MAQRGYEPALTLNFNYRNCTDYAARTLNRQLGGTTTDIRCNWSSIQSGNSDHAKDWRQGAINRGKPVDNMPKRGAVAWWGASHGGGYGHAIVAEVRDGGNTVVVHEYNGSNTGRFGTRTLMRSGEWPQASLHIADLPDAPLAGPAAPGAITVLTHGSRVNLSWGASAGTADYQVYRDGLLVATVGGTTHLDAHVLLGQSYNYTVVARNSAGISPGTVKRISTNFEAADRAYLPTKDGPAQCGRAGGQHYQALVCTMHTSTGWSSVSTGHGDWEYLADRRWLPNRDGTVSYCRRVGAGGQIMCDRFDGVTWTSSTSPNVDVGYPEDRAVLATKDGPVLCGRAGGDNYQVLVCTVLTSTGWRSVYSGGGGWGYPADRSWLVNRDGTVSYCARVGDGGQVRCDRFDGTMWTSSTSPQVDVGYPDNRTYLATKDGPALCGRAGGQEWQVLVCTVLTPNGWTSVTSGRGDWGYGSDRAWLTNNDGSVSYCRRVGTGGNGLVTAWDGGDRGQCGPERVL
ncbi:hypothetical protein GCM10011609_33620 [Lentzea pudingi]|uniref:Peptidase C51 domain-containing protein n=1 Tax=Lentzea pudingi TaxID=1789439 RepID=A0ABQ2HYA6_9PSEU|nr:CHAP domain-containing protein [Lentzea pudingi]GGM93398.1 hypothetical protein GCM10011609_33620 [Lentzea pudingi]